MASPRWLKPEMSGVDEALRHAREVALDLGGARAQSLMQRDRGGVVAGDAELGGQLRRGRDVVAAAEHFLQQLERTDVLARAPAGKKRREELGRVALLL